MMDSGLTGDLVAYEFRLIGFCTKWYSKRTRALAHFYKG